MSSRSPQSSQASLSPKHIWEHPVVGEVRGVRQKTQFTDVDAQMFQSNLIGLVVLAFCIVTGVSTSVHEALNLFWKPLSTVWTYSLIVFAALFVWNTITTAQKWFAPPLRVDELALTPHQKRLFGLKGNGEVSEADQIVPETSPPFSSGVIRSPPDSALGKTPVRSPMYSTPSRIREGDEPTSFRSQKGSERRNVYSPSIGSMSPLGAYLSRTSPRGDDLIRDRRSLERMINESDLYGDRSFTMSPAGGVEAETQTASFTPMLMSTTPLIKRFQAAAKSAQDSDRAVTERFEDGLIVKDPYSSVNSLGISRAIEEWSENMRKWLGTKLLLPLMERIDRVDSTFRENGFEHLNCRRPAQNIIPAMNVTAGVGLGSTGGSGGGPFGTFGATGGSNFMGKSAGSGLGKSFGTGMVQPAAPTNQVPQTLFELNQRFGDNPFVQERLKLESYLQMPDYQDCRGYIIERIYALAKGGYLAAFHWSAGGSWEGRDWSADHLPTDAQLVMHLFCRFMDENMPWENQNVYGSHPFSNKYFLTTTGKIDSSKSSSVLIRQVQKHPPHFNVVAEKIIWDTFPKRNNLFQTLCIFVYYVKTTAGGYLGLLNLGGRAIDLISVVGPEQNADHSSSMLRSGGSY
ncbi:cytochrome B561, N terminal-domain-containing protein [Cladochytrium replicatum]|nr:cytochrome B561, N terminal-domain-containing protein [Cladochytrium replicatum]